MAVPVDRVVGDADAVRAARQSGLLFLMSGLLSLAVIPTIPGRTGVLLLITGLDLAVAALTLVLPWGRWGLARTAVLGLVAWVLIGAATWGLGGFGTGAGAFFVLAFAWMGLHHSRRMILAHAPLAAAAYVGALISTGAPLSVLTTAIVLVPISVSVGLIIEGRVRRLKAARELLEEEQRWRAALMATLAHDVRSPLATIQGALEIVDDDPGVPHHLRPLLASASRQASRLTALASNLLDLERVEGGKLVLDWQRVDLTEFVEQVADLLEDRDVVVRVESALVVRVDPLRLQQMLVNLVNNALHHGEAPVVISTRRTAGHIEISVRDHGSGVPAEGRAMLFQRLNRTEGNPESVGLGLWIVKLLAQAHGGDAYYQPAVPGAEFVIALPTELAQDPQPLPADGSGQLPARTTP